MRGIIFLDIDGVMNTNNMDLKLQGGFVSWPDSADHPFRDQFQRNPNGEYNPGFTKESIECIQELYNTCNSDIVISSTWRHDVLMSKFDQYLGLPERSVVGYTPDLSGSLPVRGDRAFEITRAIEIETFLAVNHAYGMDASYVVIDDLPIAVPSSKLVLTNSFTGLTKKELPEIKSILGV